MAQTSDCPFSIVKKGVRKIRHAFEVVVSQIKPNPKESGFSPGYGINKLGFYCINNFIECFDFGFADFSQLDSGIDNHFTKAGSFVDDHS
jgi:hypothetical protein